MFFRKKKEVEVKNYIISEIRCKKCNRWCVRGTNLITGKPSNIAICDNCGQTYEIKEKEIMK